jgi:hypothetical protein
LGNPSPPGFWAKIADNGGQLGHRAMALNPGRTLLAFCPASGRAAALYLRYPQPILRTDATIIVSFSLPRQSGSFHREMIQLMSLLTQRRDMRNLPQGSMIAALPVDDLQLPWIASFAVDRAANAFAGNSRVASGTKRPRLSNRRRYQSTGPQPQLASLSKSGHSALEACLHGKINGCPCSFARTTAAARITAASEISFIRHSFLVLFVRIGFVSIGYVSVKAQC